MKDKDFAEHISKELNNINDEIKKINKKETDDDYFKRKEENDKFFFS